MTAIKGRLVPNSGRNGNDQLSSLEQIDAGDGHIATHISSDVLVYFQLLYPKPYTVYNATSKVTALINPESFSENIEPQYSKRPVIGLSHEIIQ